MLIDPGTFLNRWKPIVPVGVPHSSTAEGTYEDMHIPNGSTVFANIAYVIRALYYSSTLTLKEKIYEHGRGGATRFGRSKPRIPLILCLQMFPSSGEFKPERYLNEEASNATQSIFYFGFGRRICPGLHVAQNSLFIVIARYFLCFYYALLG